MRGNTFGNVLTLTSFGESHGPALGAVIDGCPAGIEIDTRDFETALRRRRPGQSAITTDRREKDIPEILSGIFEGKTLGTPIAVLVRNTDARGSDYSPDTYRLGHADKAWEKKYGIRDYRGGGRASGRETLSRVIGGVVAEKILPPGLRIVAFTRQIETIEVQNIPGDLTRDAVDATPTRCPDEKTSRLMEEKLLDLKQVGDSAGGVVELRMNGVPPGLGEPVFHKVKSELAAAFMSIGGVNGVTLGDATGDVLLPGSSFHETDAHDANSSPGSHGIQGGITTGNPITFRIYIKPPSTIGEMSRKGRHDPCIVPRVVPVIEAMAALVLADFYLLSRLDRHTS